MLFLAFGLDNPFDIGCLNRSKYMHILCIKSYFLWSNNSRYTFPYCLPLACDIFQHMIGNKFHLCHWFWYWSRDREKKNRKQIIIFWWRDLLVLMNVFSIWLSESSICLWFSFENEEKNNQKPNVSRSISMNMYI